MRKCITVHGIRVTNRDYAYPLVGNINDVDIAWSFLHWGSSVYDTLNKYDQIFKQPDLPFWRLGSKFKRWLFQEIHESLLWIRAYEDEEIGGKIRREAIARILQIHTSTPGPINIVGHSLGGIIAMDSIHECLTSGVLVKKDIGSIITMGSPIRHWKTYSTLKKRLSEIVFSEKWINIVDNSDVLAGEIHAVDDRIQDVEVDVGRLFVAHVGYWDSPIVAEIVRKVLV